MFYRIYDKVPLKLMLFFVVVKGCVNFHEITSGAFSKNDRITFKFNSSLFLLSD